MVNIIPAELYAPYSKILPFPQTMTAGTTYTVNMQPRDFYHNNIIKLLS